MKFHFTATLLVLGFLGSREVTRADAFLYNNGVFTTFEVPGAIPGSTLPYCINNLGQIVGEFVDSTDQFRGFLDTNGVFTVLNLPGVPVAINDLGQIIGPFFGSGSV